MTISYSLSPMPKWYISDLTGKPLGGGAMYTYSSLDKNTQKFIFQDPAGNFPWTDPVLFDENGAQGPFYWEFDSDNPDETYYIEVYDSAGVLQWTIDDYFPPSGGGSAVITTALDLENLIVNNVFWRGTLGTTGTSTSTLLRLAPGAHSAFANNSANLPGKYTGPDIYFIKNNTNATDTLSLKKFNVGDTPFTGDVTPVSYLNYTCSNTPASETIKCVQFPITTAVQNLSNQDVTLTIWARCNSGNTNLILQWYQFFGDGAGATVPATTTIETLNLTSSWNKYVITATVPDVSGATLGSLGACANDALFLQVAYSLGVITNIDFTKPSLYLGNISPQEDYHTYDMIDSIISAQRTGYIMSGYDTTSPPGYVILDDGTIGSAASSATNRSNSDTFALYNLLYNNVTVPSSNSLCVVSGYTGNAVTDYTANRTMQLPVMLGRALCSAGSGAGLTARTLGSIFGEETHTLTPEEIPELDVDVAQESRLGAPTSGGNVMTATGSLTGYTLHITGNTTNTGDGPHNNMQPSSFINFFIKL